MEMCLKVSDGSEPDSEPLKKAIGVAKWWSGHQNISNFSMCKAQAKQRKIRIVFFEHNKNIKLLPKDL